jgi:hypothetical protein
VTSPYCMFAQNKDRSLMYHHNINENPLSVAAQEDLWVNYWRGIGLGSNFSKIPSVVEYDRE